ncbi:uncharacterized protein LOC135821405 [Sycon ciliatum]|uniref:uncharacterized protein LOC135821405 n=1 Tax=Sycon ciliatum TaxID=27933 RepID=UPI0031F663CF
MATASETSDVRNTSTVGMATSPAGTTTEAGESQSSERPQSVAWEIDFGMQASTAASIRRSVSKVKRGGKKQSAGSSNPVRGRPSVSAGVNHGRSHKLSGPALAANRVRKALAKKAAEQKKESPPLARRMSVTKISPPVAKRASPPSEKKHGLAKENDAGLPADMEASPPTEKKASPLVGKKASPPIAKKSSPPMEKRESPPMEKRLSAPLGKKASPPIEKKSSPPLAKKAANSSDGPTAAAANVAGAQDRAGNLSTTPAQPSVAVRKGSRRPAAGAAGNRRAANGNNAPRGAVMCRRPEYEDGGLEPGSITHLDAELITAESLAQRKVLDMRRWYCISRPQYNASCGISSVVGVWNFLFSTLGHGELSPITQEQAFTILGFDPPYNEIKFGAVAGNHMLMKWFQALNVHFQVSGMSTYMYKPRGYNQTRYNSVQALAQIKAALHSNDCALIYHCTNHYMCPIGYEDTPKTSASAYRGILSESEVRTWLIIGDTSNCSQPLLSCKWENVVKDLELNLPQYYNIKQPHKGIQARKGAWRRGGNINCIMLFKRSAVQRSRLYLKRPLTSVNSNSDEEDEAEAEADGTLESESSAAVAQAESADAVEHDQQENEQQENEQQENKDEDEGDGEAPEDDCMC